MINLLTGPKGSGKTQQMIELANHRAKACGGSVVFMKNSHRDTRSVTFDIRVVCMDDYPAIDNTDEYIGFLYGMYSANHDVECIFIDGVLKHTHINLADMPRFIDRLKSISSECKIDFYVSVSADKDELKDVNFADCTLLN